MKSDHVRRYLRNAGASTAEINVICRHPRMNLIVRRVVEEAEKGGYECAIRRAVNKVFGVSGELISKILYTHPPVVPGGVPEMVRLPEDLERPEASTENFETPEKPLRDPDFSVPAPEPEMD